MTLTLRRGVLPALFITTFGPAAPLIAAVYPPTTGPVARHQAVRDLESSAVVLVVAAEPGEEDLASLAALRMGEGARVVVAFVTDGGTTPSDAEGALPIHVAGRRRFEADAALRAVGAEPYFMGFPDYGFVASESELERLWSRDSLLARFVGAIRSVRPDVILIEHDTREDEGDTVRQALIRKIALMSVKRGAGAGGVEGMPGPWSVSRVCEESAGYPGGLSLPLDRVDPHLGKTYRAIAADAARAYRSLRHSLEGLSAGRRGVYRVVRGEGVAAGGVTAGCPFIPQGLKGAEAAVRRAAKASAGGPDNAALGAIAEAIAVVEHAIADARGRLTNPERRLLLGWKDGLEALRCVVLGVDIRFTVSDTLVARRQEFTLRFPNDRRFPAGGMSEIIFPAAMDTTWLINGTEGFRFAFRLPDTVNLLTPGDMPWNRPVSSNVSESRTLNTSVPFIIAHKGADLFRRFALKREILLGVSPNQSAEFLTPFVRVTPGERLVVRLQNVSRDTYRGTMSVGDSVVRPAAMRIALKRSDGPVDESLPLAWRDDAADGDHVIALRIGKGPPVGTFVARKFSAIADTSRPVGFLTGVRRSPIEAALRRLHVACVPLEDVHGDSSLAPLGTVIVDRDAIALRRDGARASAALEAWVRKGGHCILLAQRWTTESGGPLARLVRFSSPRLFAPEGSVAADDSAGPAGSPNRLGEADWRGWIISRARATVDLEGVTGAVAWCRDRATGAVLGATFPVGEGSITAVTLDISPQVQIVHPGAFRLLANLVSR
ncbi:MAG TPA: PIG-L family deacetylase [Bacteroidota bacterium]|nr:PIG-L family deacetylase [Bacteroidota bacterium]